MAGLFILLRDSWLLFTSLCSLVFNYARTKWQKPSRFRFGKRFWDTFAFGIFIYCSFVMTGLFISLRDSWLLFTCLCSLVFKYYARTKWPKPSRFRFGKRFWDTFDIYLVLYWYLYYARTKPHDVFFRSLYARITCLCVLYLFTAQVLCVLLCILYLFTVQVLCVFCVSLLRTDKNPHKRLSGTPIGICS